MRINLTGAPGDWVGGKDVVLTLLRDLGVSGALYQAVEYGGPGLNGLSMDARFTIANMAIEMGAKNAIFEADERCLAYVREHVDRQYAVIAPDKDAAYQCEVNVDLADIQPMVAYPPLPSNGRAVNKAERIPLHEVLIGSCTNGRLSDLAMAAQIIQGRQAAKGVRVLIIPGTQRIYLEALRRGYIETFVEAGCAVSTPTCGACGGGHMGLMGRGERVLSTSNRNFTGRMGHIDSEIYLCGPAVAAASAIAGYITGPDGLDRMKGQEEPW
jgi:3-isopropylmalate/(R)-2-methylmalate dehydratase large subunit